MRQAIGGFHLDEEGHWTADLVCGHRQHVRHDPPLMSRPWVLVPEGRASRLGHLLECKRCDELGAALAEAVRAACIACAEDAFEDGGIRGLCPEGRLELVRDRLRATDFGSVVSDAIRALIEEWELRKRSGPPK
ncbi:MAG: DUF3565 domain-containing protein [Bdellovibrionales bacterium]|nr:DUF3565 domain-containing protein [Bdellovibrionales bacterium]